VERCGAAVFHEASASFTHISCRTSLFPCALYDAANILTSLSLCRVARALDMKESLMYRLFAIAATKAQTYE